MIGLALGAPLAGGLLLLILIGSLSESFSAWLAQFISPIEIFGALLFVGFLVIVFGPVIEAAETGLAMFDWITGGMR